MNVINVQIENVFVRKR